MLVYMLTNGIDPSTVEDYEALIYTLQDELMKYSLIVSSISSALTIPVGGLFMYLDTKRGERLGIRRIYSKPTVGDCLLLFVLGIFVSITLNNLLEVSGLAAFFMKDIEAVEAGQYLGNIPLEILSLGLLAPLSEEIIFRGLTQGRCHEIMFPGMAIAVSVMVFTWYHGNLIQSMYAFGTGMLFAYTYYRYKSIIASLMVHIGANVISVIGTETELLTPIFENTTMYIAYIVVSAMASIGLLYFVVFGKGVELIRPSAVELAAKEQAQDQ